MKVILLAGGLGTRLSEYTGAIPKPMVPIGDKPILHHIMQIYANYGHKDFYIALGYKSAVIKEYFKTIDNKWKINLVDIGNENKIKLYNSDKKLYNSSIISKKKFISLNLVLEFGLDILNKSFVIGIVPNNNEKITND